jgi:2-keto-4-pentenoate hydratase/2-oxohepta-3-ene-1,7-dioic acid hydratase in catechol pathway
MAFNRREKKAEVKKLLAPLAPIQILAIGLNYRRHAEVELDIVLGAE